MRIVRFGDLQAGEIFLAEQPEARRRLAVHPVHVLGFSLESPEVQALFRNVRMRDAARIEDRLQRAVPYLAVSLVPMTEQEMDSVLVDQMCRGLWILLQNSENLPESSASRSLPASLHALLKKGWRSRNRDRIPSKSG